MRARVGVNPFLSAWCGASAVGALPKKLSSQLYYTPASLIATGGFIPNPTAFGPLVISIPTARKEGRTLVAHERLGRVKEALALTHYRHKCDHTAGRKPLTYHNLLTLADATSQPNQVLLPDVADTLDKYRHHPSEIRKPIRAGRKRRDLRHSRKLSTEEPGEEKKEDVALEGREEVASPGRADRSLHHSTDHLPENDGSLQQWVWPQQRPSPRHHPDAETVVRGPQDDGPAVNIAKGNRDAATSVAKLLSGLNLAGSWSKSRVAIQGSQAVAGASTLTWGGFVEGDGAPTQFFNKGPRGRTMWYMNESQEWVCDEKAGKFQGFEVRRNG